MTMFNMRLIFSLFANKIVNEESESIQKALVIAHQYYISLGNYNEALKITKLLSENQDESGCFIFANANRNFNSYFVRHLMSKLNQFVSNFPLFELPVKVCKER